MGTTKQTKETRATDSGSGEFLQPPQKDPLESWSLAINPYVLAIIIIILLALFTRFIGINIRPIHHDESLFVYYAYHWHETGNYVYIPMLHGPLMLYVTGFIFWAFGDSDITMRLAPALMGIAIIMFVLFLRRWQGKSGIIATMILLLFSPAFMHYSRFFRHDIPLAFFYVILFFILERLLHKETKPWTIFFAVLVSATLVCIKENSLMLLFTYATFGIVLFFVDIVSHKQSIKTAKGKYIEHSLTSDLLVGALGAFLFLMLIWLAYFFTGEGTLEVFKTKNFIAFKAPWEQYFLLVCAMLALTPIFAWLHVQVIKDKNHELLITRFWNSIARHWIFLLVGIFVALALYILIFTDFFKHPKGIFQIYRDTFAYWWGQHKEHRIKGEFHFYWVLLFLYELPALIIILSGAIKDLLRYRWIKLWLIPGFFLFAILLAAGFSGTKINSEWWDAVLHLTSKWHIFMIATVVLFGVTLTVLYILERSRFKAFLLWWFFVSLLLYSYAGEKVPWVSVHISIPLLLLAGLYIAEFVKTQKFLKHQRFWLTIFALMIVLQIRNCVLLCFYYYDDARDRMNYSQTYNDLKKVAREIDHIAFLTNGKQTEIVAKGEAIWPLRWYLRHYKNWSEYKDVNTTTAPVIVCDLKEAQETGNIQENYRIRKCTVRSWWQPKSDSIRVMLGIWRWLIPQEKRTGDTGISLKDARDEWKKVLNWVLYRETFDHYGSKFPTYSTMDFAFCIRKDVVY